MVDCWKLEQYHKVMRQSQITIVKFAGVVGQQLIECTDMVIAPAWQQ